MYVASNSFASLPSPCCSSFFFFSYYPSAHPSSSLFIRSFLSRISYHYILIHSLPFFLSPRDVRSFSLNTCRVSCQFLCPLIYYSLYLSIIIIIIIFFLFIFLFLFFFLVESPPKMLLLKNSIFCILPILAAAIGLARGKPSKPHPRP